MKVMVILGSRNPNGKTAKAAEALLSGLTSEGNHQFEQVFLPQMNVERCRQCENDGWGICWTEGRCIIEDDFPVLVNKIKNADLVIFVNPVYFGDLSESMRAFLDRLRRTCRHEGGRDGIYNKIAIGICVAGGGGGGAAECTVSLERVLYNCGFDVFDIVPARRQNLEMKLAVLKTSGKWLASKLI